jgi:hypothetical protein
MIHIYDVKITNKNFYSLFFINASFYVFLKGPMCTFPFWTRLGLNLLPKDQAHLVEPIAKTNLEN